MRRKLLVRIVTAVVGWAALGGGPAWAYLPSAEVILASVAETRAQLALQTLVAEGYVPGTEPLTRVWTALRADVGMRTELRGPDGTDVELILGRDRYRFRSGEPAPGPERLRAAPLVELLGIPREDPGGRRGLALLARLQIDPQVVSLARFDGRPVFVIGAGPGQLDRPQLWIDKRYQVPVRWLHRNDGGLEETRLLGFGMPTVGPWFPERIEVWRDGEPVRVLRYTRARINAPVEARDLRPPPAS